MPDPQSEVILTPTDPQRLSKAVQQVLDRLEDSQVQRRIAQLHRQERERQEERRQQQLEEHRRNLWAARGERYSSCSLNNFDVGHDQYQPDRILMRSRIQQYQENIGQNIDEGVNLILLGPPGSGKDHLMASLFNPAFDAGYRVLWTSGQALFSDFRQAIERHESDSELVNNYVCPNVLALSDPMPVTGSLTPYQQEMLYAILDARYNRRACVWVTINAVGRAEANAALGAKLVDRLVDGAVSLACNWPSYRRSRD